IAGDKGKALAAAVERDRPDDRGEEPADTGDEKTFSELELDLIKFELRENDEADGHADDRRYEERAAGLPLLKVQRRHHAGQHKDTFDKGDDAQYFNDRFKIDSHISLPCQDSSNAAKTAPA